MSKLDYDKIQILQENTTKKLIKYINEFVKKGKSLDSIEFYFPDFDKQKTKLAFNVWISIDYRTDSGKSFIEHMLDEESNQLSSLEKNILVERNKSFISLFEIEHIKGEYIYVLDLLTKKRHTLWEPNTVNILNKSDLIFGRIGKIIDFKGFIGNISFLPSSVKDKFIEKVFIGYNRTKFKQPNLSINRYLKLFSINIYRIYTECIHEMLDMELEDGEDITSILYDELDEFENHLQNNMSMPNIKRHITNLINLFEYYLVDDGFSLNDLAQLDIEDILINAIEDGFISSQRELSSYISTLKIYLRYLKNMDQSYKKSYKSILKISKNRFMYIDHTKNNKSIFNINRSISTNIIHDINEIAYDFIMDYEKFLLFLMSTPLELTERKKNIKRKVLLELNSIMENQENITKQAPNQIDFPLIDLFYRFSINNKLVKIEKNMLTITKKASHFLRLTDEEKFSLFIQYIWKDEFLLYINNNLDINETKSIKQRMLTLFNDLEEGIFYKYSNFISEDVKFSKLVINYCRYLKLLGLFKYSNYPTLNISITPFGKLIFNILMNKDDLKNNSGKVIYLNQL
ncbi:hypothetical protein K8M07_06275 [Schnuerera sp. xch1]|uniref:hypothetical protein n=1 Tax=Schnuerera sp. xch1 TaxID=2874283 RepID=UPI001CC036F4|nr:hypothetical protein [Schnuerera sp. xch1]MBZ2174853.1 hypothetical protein [Schnuerera sp. xch1]